MLPWKTGQNVQELPSDYFLQLQMSLHYLNKNLNQEYEKILTLTGNQRCSILNNEMIRKLVKKKN